ncbi:MAG: RagB/SusD family nutrient uptake outer membrane protein [Bacteroidales bacterium]|nr:RagB/SusD family nutrient uptake outer membrane protein [Bacteroidales bacterium]
MKKYIFILLALVLAVSCNDEAFLEEKTYNDDTSSFFKNQQAIEIALASAYSNIQYMVFGNQRGGSEHNWMLNGMGLDTFAPTGGNTHFSNWSTLTPDSGYARHYGDYMYKLANRANTVVDMIDEHPEIEYDSATKKDELRAEAVFLRAWAYRVLAGMFGCLVYADHMTQEARYDYEMISREEGWKLLAEDFKYCEENLPSKPRLMGTVTKAAAAHYLSEIYLSLGQFAEAEAAASRVIGGQDGDYHLMTTRFGNRKSDAVDRYGNSLAAPQGAYWDLFRSSAMSDGKFAADSNPNDSENKEAIWVAQIDYTPGVDNWPLGGSGDSWWRMHVPVLESTWAPWIPMGGKNGTRVGTDGVKYYVFTADATCFPEGVAPAGAGNPAADIPEAQGRKLAYSISTRMDSLACRAQGNGAATALGLLASEFVQRPAGDVLGSYWDDPNDFRGSETMIQRDYYTPSGKKWSEVKAAIAARAAAHPGDATYVLTAADTVNITPRFWKFSDDKHIIDNSNCFYDTDWYMVRIAETYLLRAEARLAQGNKSGAAEDINVLRNRAGARPCTAADIDIDYILDERVRELFGEEQRWVTLSRLSCNPNATYVLDKYPTQNATTSNTLYERTRKYGFGYENEDRGREAYTDALGNTRHRPNIMPHNYVLPIPIQIIDSNKDREIPQNQGY